MASVHFKANLKEHWQKPPTSVYKDNFGFAINYYQPMIDYLDAKESGSVKTARPPHLPWSNERALEKYRPSNLIRCYSKGDLTRLAVDAEHKAKESLQQFKTVKHSDLSLSSTVKATKVTKQVLKETKVDTLSKQLKNRMSSSCENIAGLDLADTSHVLRTIRASSAIDSVKDILYKTSAKHIEAGLLNESYRNLSRNTEVDVRGFQSRACSAVHDHLDHQVSMNMRQKQTLENESCLRTPLGGLKQELDKFTKKTDNYLLDTRKQTSIEIEQLSARVVEAETRLKTEVTRIKKKLQIQITELELSLDVANKNNIELQKTVKRQSLQLTEIQAHYDEIQRQLAVTIDQLGIAQRRVQSLTGELEDTRGNFEAALRAKRTIEQSYEEAVSRVNELTTINVNISSSKAKIEQELSQLANDYDEVAKELRVSDERYQRVQTELKHTVEILHEEQERIVKIETIKKSLEIEVKNLSVRLEEVEANAIVGGKRVISKLEARIRDVELELDEEKRRHAETIKILRKKERQVKEITIQSEDDHNSIILLQEALDKVNQKVGIYKRQLQEQEGLSSQSVTRSRRFQRELEAAEERADTAESNLSLIRAKHRTFVTTSTVPGSQVYLVQETRHTTTQETL